MNTLESLGWWGLFLGNLLAATIVPFSSDALYIAFLELTKQAPLCFLVATAGNWLGSVISFGMGWVGRLEWIEKYFKVKHETLEKQKAMIAKYGSWLALLCWVPIIGDVIAIALGFYTAPPLRCDDADRKGRSLVDLDLIARIQSFLKLERYRRSILSCELPFPRYAPFFEFILYLRLIPARCISN